MWLHLLVVAVVVLVLRSTMPESQEWAAARERADDGEWPTSRATAWTPGAS